MFSAVYGMTVLGLEAHLIRVEVDVANGLPGFEFVGTFTTHAKLTRQIGSDAAI